MKRKVIIVGAGASGLFCAYLLAQMGCSPLVLESEAQIGRKLGISGGGYANFTNMDMDVTYYMAEPLPDFGKKILQNFTPHDMLRHLRALGFAWQEKSHGRLFLREHASRLAQALAGNAIKHGAKILHNRKVIALAAERHAKNLLTVKTESEVFTASNVVLAQGSPAGGKISGTGVKIHLASQIGHNIIPWQPALVPMQYSHEFEQRDSFSSLAGISLSAVVELKNKIINKKWQDGILFTHRGLSGPAILSASLYWLKGDSIAVNFLPDIDFEKILDEFPKSTPISSLKKCLPDRLVNVILNHEASSKKNGQLSRASRKALAARVHHFIFAGLHKGSMAQAETSKGGVDLLEIDNVNLKSKINPAICLIGETVNIKGELGGYNLHWAFASAAASARAIAGHKP